MNDLETLNGKLILITGATGLIGKAVIKKLIEWNRYADVPVKMIALVRDIEKAKKIFNRYGSNDISYLVSDICNLKPQKMNIDYIIHGANQTSSLAFINEPVETALTAINGTKNILELARVNPVKGLVYLSSMEVYGTPVTDEKINEQHSTNLNPMTVRSSYPESKRMCESLCASYTSEYNIPAKVIRLTQTFGSGVQYNDGRVFAEFARCVIENKDIVLHTKGETKRSYLYTEDAANAILTVLINGITGEAYNAANESTYCSIYEMACLVAEKCADGKINVIIEEKDNAKRLGYAPTLHMNLDTSKLCDLGWKAETDLPEMFCTMIAEMRRMS